MKQNKMTNLIRVQFLTFFTKKNGVLHIYLNECFICKIWVDIIPIWDMETINTIKQNTEKQAKQKIKMLEQLLYVMCKKEHTIRQQKMNNEFNEIIFQADNFQKMVEMQLF